MYITMCGATRLDATSEKVYKLLAKSPAVPADLKGAMRLACEDLDQVLRASEIVTATKRSKHHGKGPFAIVQRQYIDGGLLQHMPKRCDDDRL